MKLVKFLILLTLILAAKTLSAQTTESSDSLAFRTITTECATLPATYNNKITLFKTGADKFKSMFADIEKAKHHIHLDYFNFRNDSIGNALFDLLARKAKEGVEVRAMFDAFGNSSNNKPLQKEHLQKIRNNGIEIHKFKPGRFPYVDQLLGSRDHRKIVVIDGKIAYTGGMNVADYYIEGLPEIGAWRDLHIRIVGDAVPQFQKNFIDLWNKATKQKIDDDKYFVPADTLEQGDKCVVVVDRTPHQSPQQVRCAYATSMANAQKSIKIVNPYFVPTHRVKKELKRALKRGIDVQIMISAKSDIGFTPDGAKHVAHAMMKRGAKIYLFNGGFHHSKIMMVDDLFCTIGSTNLDSRSLRYDYEINTFIFDKETTADLTQMFETDKLNSTLMTPELWKKRSAWKKFVGWLARSLTFIL